MKQNKRIIQHLIQQSKNKIELNNNNYHRPAGNASLDVPINETQTVQNTIDQQSCDISVQLQPTFNFEIFVQIGDGRSDTIFMNQNSNPLIEAERFCQKHGLDKYIINLLADSLEQQAQKQKQLIKSSLKSPNLQSKTKIYQQSNKLISQNNLYKFNKNSQQIWKQAEINWTGKPSINPVSEAIVQKVGKDKIISIMNKKFHDKVQKHIMQQFQNEQKQFSGFSFHPNINPISRKVDQTLHVSRNNSRENVTRYEHLYQQHKLIQNKKEMQRRNSLMDIPFHPIINKVSKTIMHKKRSLEDLYSYSVQKNKKTAQLQKLNLKKQQQPRRKRSRNSLSASSSQICYHLYQQAKKRQQKIKKQTERIYNNDNNWRIIQNSNSLVNNLRENRIRQIFYTLTHPPHKILNHSQICYEKLDQFQRLCIPIFNEMKDVRTDLTQQQFVQAGLRLFKFLSPNQRAILIKRKSNFFQQKQNSSKVCQINKKSQQIIKQKKYGQQSIYMRGLIYRKQVKNQIQKGKQEKVRKQLKGCTFKPKIHKIAQNAAY